MRAVFRRKAELRPALARGGPAAPKRPRRRRRRRRNTSGRFFFFFIPPCVTHATAMNRVEARNLFSRTRARLVGGVSMPCDANVLRKAAQSCGTMIHSRALDSQRVNMWHWQIEWGVNRVLLVYRSGYRHIYVNKYTYTHTHTRHILAQEHQTGSQGAFTSRVHLRHADIKYGTNKWNDTTPAHERCGIWSKIWSHILPHRHSIGRKKKNIPFDVRMGNRKGNMLRRRSISYVNMTRRVQGHSICK